MHLLRFLSPGLAALLLMSPPTAPAAPQWHEVELTFESATTHARPYLEVDAWVDFIHTSGVRIRRPMQ